MAALIQVIIKDKGIVSFNASREWPMGMRMKEVFLHCIRAYLLKTKAEPGAFRFEIERLEPSHMDGVPITHVCTPCVIYSRVVDASGIPEGPAEGSPSLGAAAAAKVSC